MNRRAECRVELATIGCRVTVNVGHFDISIDQDREHEDQNTMQNCRATD